MDLSLDTVGEKVLLIGNGPNRTQNGDSWEDILHSLTKHVGVSGNNHLNKRKPFPLLYEELYLFGHKLRGISESQIKQFIAKRTSRLEPTPTHRLLWGSGITHFLTTNYDHTFERIHSSEKSPFKNHGYVNEGRYNLFRRYELRGKSIWHIHGDQQKPRTITLGYEHYSGYLQQMRSYVVLGVTYKKGFIPSLRERLRERNSRVYSWIDFFFSNDIFILGLTLDFIEIHLWWLLTYRAREQVKKKMQISGKIFYIYKDMNQHFDRRMSAKLALLKATGVKIVPITARNGDWEDFYVQALDFVENA